MLTIHSGDKKLPSYVRFFLPITLNLSLLVSLTSRNGNSFPLFTLSKALYCFDQLCLISSKPSLLCGGKVLFNHAILHHKISPVESQNLLSFLNDEVWNYIQCAPARVKQFLNSFNITFYPPEIVLLLLVLKQSSGTP